MDKKNSVQLLKTFLFSLFSLVFITSCSDDDDVKVYPLTEGTSITLRNTLQDPGEFEVTYPSLFGQPDNAYDEQAVLSNSNIEFATALVQNGTPVGDISGLFKIDFTQSKITYTVLPQLDDPFWGDIADVFGVTAEGKFDRYYFTFSKEHNIKGFTSSDPAIKLRIDLNKIIVVEVGAGFNLQPGTSFTIDLK